MSPEEVQHWYKQEIMSHRDEYPNLYKIEEDKIRYKMSTR